MFERLMRFARGNTERTIAIAEFADKDVADEAWIRLQEAEIPAAVLTDTAPFGGAPVTRVEVERSHVARAQALIADLVTDQHPG